jgi:hypothetical protein
MTYAEKLKDPRWQKRRLEVLEDRGWKCEACADTDMTLHVHHDKYKGQPWEAENEDLFVLCEECHSKVHKAKINASDYLIALNDLEFGLCYMAFEQTMAEELGIDGPTILRLIVTFYNRFENMKIDKFMEERKNNGLD